MIQEAGLHFSKGLSGGLCVREREQGGEAV